MATTSETCETSETDKEIESLKRKVESAEKKLEYLNKEIAETEKFCESCTSKQERKYHQHRLRTKREDYEITNETLADLRQDLNAMIYPTLPPDRQLDMLKQQLEQLQK